VYKATSGTGSSAPTLTNSSYQIGSSGAGGPGGFWGNSVVLQADPGNSGLTGQTD